MTGPTSQPEAPATVPSLPTPVEAPALLAPAPAVLGSLAPALRRLAGLQGSWPPRPAAQARHLEPGRTGSAAQGRALADGWADEGADLLVVEPDADPTGAVVALAVLLGLEPVAALGTGGGRDWAGRITAVRAALPAARAVRSDIDALLEQVADPALALAVGVLEQGARRRTPLLVGSTPTAVAAMLLADRRAPGAVAWALAASTCAVPAAERALLALGLDPVLDLRLPGAGGAALAGAVLQAALPLVPPAA